MPMSSQQPPQPPQHANESTPIAGSLLRSWQRSDGAASPIFGSEGGGPHAGGGSEALPPMATPEKDGGETWESSIGEIFSICSSRDSPGLGLPSSHDTNGVGISSGGAAAGGSGDRQREEESWQCPSKTVRDTFSTEGFTVLAGVGCRIDESGEDATERHRVTPPSCWKKEDTVVSSSVLGETRKSKKVGCIGSRKAHGGLDLNGTPEPADVEPADMEVVTDGAATTMLGHEAPLKSCYWSSNGDNIYRRNAYGDNMNSLLSRGHGSRGEDRSLFLFDAGRNEQPKATAPTTARVGDIGIDAAVEVAPLSGTSSPPVSVHSSDVGSGMDALAGSPGTRELAWATAEPLPLTPSANANSAKVSDMPSMERGSGASPEAAVGQELGFGAGEVIDTETGGERSVNPPPSSPGPLRMDVSARAPEASPCHDLDDKRDGWQASAKRFLLQTAEAVKLLFTSAAASIEKMLTPSVNVRSEDLSHVPPMERDSGASPEAAVVQELGIDAGEVIDTETGGERIANPPPPSPCPFRMDAEPRAPEAARRDDLDAQKDGWQASAKRFQLQAVESVKLLFTSAAAWIEEYFSFRPDDARGGRGASESGSVEEC